MAFPEPPHQRQNFLGGFKLTLEHLARQPVTRQYPEEKRPKQPRQHGRHVLNRYEDGMEKCIGCELCAGVCPADCIYVRGLDNPPDHPVSPGERYGYVYEINFLRCIHCDLCVEACPTEAITESKLMEFSFTNRNDAIYTKSELLVDDEGHPKHLPWEDWREGDDLHTSGWMRATSPSGSAAAEGRVQWSGELGYGTRVPEAGQSPGRDDAGTGTRMLRDTLERHLSPGDLPEEKRGPKGAIGRMLEKAERFAPGAGRKHRVRADASYAASLAAGQGDRSGATSGEPAPSAGSARLIGPVGSEPPAVEGPGVRSREPRSGDDR
ncbi:MAG: NADH-quinone oxidoreductase subunit NuoI [Acidimicrobiales bacterium]